MHSPNFFGLCYNILMRTFYLNPVIYNKLYSVMQYKNALALRTSLETGLRIDDVLSLKCEQLNKRTLVGRASKTGKVFRKVVSVDLSKRLFEIKGEVYIFEGRLNKNKHRTRQAVWKDVKKAAEILEIDGNIAPHSARKTYAVEKFKDSGLGAVQKGLQHTDIHTTMLYAFADYLDNEPHLSATARKSGSDKKLPTKGAKNDTDENRAFFDGDFWITFADLVAEKTVKRLLELIKPRKKT